jgi:hypothetical protein
MTSTRAMVRDSSASGTRETSPETVMQDRDISSNHKISGGKGAGQRYRRGRHRKRPQNSLELEQVRATRPEQKRCRPAQKEPARDWARPRRRPSANKKGRGRAGRRRSPQSNKELQRIRATRLGPKRERDQF